ncbi:Calx-beta domain-containing protein [Thermodesulfobacteriota bacterium]
MADETLLNQLISNTRDFFEDALNDGTPIADALDSAIQELLSQSAGYGLTTGQAEAIAKLALAEFHSAIDSGLSGTEAFESILKKVGEELASFDLAIPESEEGGAPGDSGEEYDIFGPGGLFGDDGLPGDDVLPGNDGSTDDDGTFGDDGFTGVDSLYGTGGLLSVDITPEDDIPPEGPQDTDPDDFVMGPRISIMADSASVLEGDDGTAIYTFTVSRSGDTGSLVSIDWEVAGSGDDPADADDFGGTFPGGEVIFFGGETEQTITVEAVGDVVFETDERFEVNLSNPSGVAQIDTDSAISEITNDDDPPSLDIAVVTTSAPEGDSGTTAYTFNVTLTGETSFSHSVDWSVTGSGDNPGNADDFGGTLPGGTVTFAAGETEKTITVEVSGDTDAEYNEGFTVTLSNASSGAVINTNTAAATIVNEDAELSIAAVDANLAEGDSGTTAFTFTVTRDGDTTVEHTVDWSVTGSGDNPAVAADFGGALPGGTVTFAAGETEKTITVDVTGEAVYEPDEGFTVTLSNPSDGAKIITDSAGSTVTNDDDPPTLDISADSASVMEGDSGTTAYTFTVTLTGETSFTHSVDWAVTGSGGDAADAADFGGTLPGGTIEFLPGEATKTITVNVTGEVIYEHDEGFTVTLSNPSNSAQIVTETATGTIANEDPVPTLDIMADSAPVSEGDSGTVEYTFVVTLTGETSFSHSVDWAVTGSGTDPADADDFGGTLPSGTVTFAPGETQKTITVQVSGDTTVENDEGFTVTLSNPTNDAAIVTATADEIIRSEEIYEGDSGTTSFNFLIAHPDGEDTVNWEVTGSGNHAADEYDFNGWPAGGPLPSGQVVFAAGETEKVVTVEVQGDEWSEYTDGFTVTLTKDSDGTVIDTIDCTIQDDDVVAGVVQSITSATTSNISLTGDGGSDTLSVDLTDPSNISGLDIGVDGLGWQDTLSVGLNAVSSVSSNAISVNGGPNYGDNEGDNISLNVTGYNVKTNTINIDGGYGSDSVAAKISASNDVSNNTINITGDVGNDTLSLDIDPVAIKTNTVNMNGGAGDDLLTVNLAATAASSATVSGANATATPSDASASNILNNINMAGETGSDTLSLDLSAAALVKVKATATSGAAIANAKTSYTYTTGTPTPITVTSTNAATAMAIMGGNSATPAAITLDGGAGNDLLSIQLAASATNSAVALGQSYAYASAHSATASNNFNNINMFGGTGDDGTNDDPMSVRILANALVYAYAAAAAGAATAYVSEHAIANLSSNFISMTGNSGNDFLSARIAGTARAQATALGTTYASAYNYLTATAYNNYNVIGMNGGSGDDTLTLDLTADVSIYMSASAPSGSAYAYASYYAGGYNSYNRITMTGDTGNNDLSVNLAVSADNFGIAVGSSYAYAYAESAVAYNDYNYIAMNGGTGIDTLSVNLIADGRAYASAQALGTTGTASAYAYAYWGYAELYGNTITMTGGGANDTLSALLLGNAKATAIASASYSATAYASYATAYNYYNNIYMYGGTTDSGDDILTLNLTADAMLYANAAAPSGSAEAYAYYAYAYVTYNNITIDGGAGNDEISALLKASAQAKATAVGSTYALASGYTASASNNYNVIAIDGGAGNEGTASDPMTVSLLADAVLYATATASAAYAYAYYVYAYNSYNSITMEGGDGVNDLTATLKATARATASAFGATYASAWNSSVEATVYDNYINMTGGTGNDTLTVNLTADAEANIFASAASGYAYAEQEDGAVANVSYNSIYMDAGDGSQNTLDVQMLAWGKEFVTATGTSADAWGNTCCSLEVTNYYNNVEMYGGTGDDKLSVSLLADATAIIKASASSLSAYAGVYYYVFAYNTSNTITMDGGAGEDTLTAILKASAHEELIANGGTYASATGAYSYSCSAYVTNNDIYMSVDTTDTVGDDLTVSLTANASLIVDVSAASGTAYAYAYYAYAYNSYNTISLTGGAGIDDISAMLAATANVKATADGTTYAYASAYEATAYNINNYVYMYGGGGNDGTASDPMTVTLLADAYAYANANATSASISTATANAYAYYAYADLYSNNITMTGGSGNDFLYAKLTATAEAKATAYGSSATASASYAIAYNTENTIHMYGGTTSGTPDTGNDTLTVDLVANALVYAKATATESTAYAYAYYAYAYNSYNTITMEGGGGIDDISAMLAASAQAKATAIGSTYASASAYLATASNYDNVIKIFGGEGNDGTTSDPISVTLLANASLYAYAKATGMSGVASAYAYYYAYADLYSNTITMTGNDGNDHMVADLAASANLDATAVAKSYAYAYAYSSAYAYNSENDISMDGGIGTDTMTVSLKADAGVYASAEAIAGSASASAYYAYAYVSYNDITMTGADDGDFLTAQLAATAKGSATAYGTESVYAGAYTATASNYSNEIYMYGGTIDAGDDTLTVNLTADASLYAKVLGTEEGGAAIADKATAYAYYAYAYNSYNTITMEGGGGIDDISAMLAASAQAKATAIGSTYASASAYLATASNYDNVIKIFGGEGNDGTTSDPISVTLLANASLYAYASATGTSGTAYAFFESAYADLYSNAIIITGDDGNDYLDAELMATAKITAKAIAKSYAYASSYSTCSATAYNTNNVISMDGGAGNDTLTVDLIADVGIYALASAESGTATAYAYYGLAYLSSNTITMYGKTGDDALSATLTAKAVEHATATGSTYAYASAYSAYAQVHSNEIYLYGGDEATVALTPNDELSLTIKASASATAKASAYLTATAYAYAYAYISNNTVTMDGGAGNDTLTIQMSVFATANANATALSTSTSTSITASIVSNNIAMYGGNGTDTLSLGISGSYVGNNAITMSGGTGSDVFDLDVSADVMQSNTFKIVDDYLANHTFSLGAGITTGATFYLAADVMSGVGLTLSGTDIVSNTVNFNGGTATDTLTLNLTASASSSSSVTANINGNNITMNGDAGGDNLTVNLNAYASFAFSANASIYSNSITMDGGAGGDNLTVNLNAYASSASIANATIYSNNITMIGGTGTDTLSLDISASYASGNNIVMNGGAGNDIINIGFSVSSASDNEITVVGGSGNDTISITASTSDAFYIFKYAGLSDVVSGSGITAVNFIDTIGGLTSSHNFSLAFKMTGTSGFNGFNTNPTSTGCGSLNAGAFTVGTAAAGADNYWIYNPISTFTAELYYDADGTGTGGAVTVAVFDADVGMTSGDITGFTVA